MDYYSIFGNLQNMYTELERERRKNMDRSFNDGGWWFIVKFLSKHCTTKREFNCIKPAHGTKARPYTALFTIEFSYCSVKEEKEEEKKIFLWLMLLLGFFSFATHRARHLGTFLVGNTWLLSLSTIHCFEGILVNFAVFTFELSLYLLPFV